MSATNQDQNWRKQFKDRSEVASCCVFNLNGTCHHSLFVLFSWRYNLLWSYFHSPVAGFRLLVFEVSRSHTTTRHSRQDSSGWVISPSQIPLPDNTQRSQQINIHAPGGIRTHNLSRRAAEDLRLRPRGYWDRHMWPLCHTNHMMIPGHFSPESSQFGVCQVGRPNDNRKKCPLIIVMFWVRNEWSYTSICLHGVDKEFTFAQPLQGICSPLRGDVPNVPRVVRL